MKTGKMSKTFDEHAYTLFGILLDCAPNATAQYELCKAYSVLTDPKEKFIYCVEELGQIVLEMRCKELLEIL